MQDVENEYSTIFTFIFNLVNQLYRVLQFL